MPGWQKGSPFWRDLKGLSGSRSPGIPWPERKPLLGYYPEGESWVAARHLGWAAEAGIDFFVYNWYWTGRPYLEHALRAYLSLKNHHGVRFAIMWVNHPPFQRSAKDWRKILFYWKKNYFSHPEYLRLQGQPLVLIFSPRKFRKELSGWQKAARIIAEMKKLAGGLFLVACLNRPATYEKLGLLVLEGYDAVTAYNYVGYSGPRVDTYENLIRFYRKTWEDYASKLREINLFLAGQKAPELEEVIARLRRERRHKKALESFLALKGSGRKLLYLVPTIPGWDDRPWKGREAFVRLGSTPAKFARHLTEARHFVSSHRKEGTVLPVVLIEAWNEFAEGSYIEPTLAWGKAYLEAVKKAFK